MNARIASLHVYPVKGARGIDADAAEVGIEGLALDGVGDREWMIVDAQDRFISQRSHRRLCLVGTAVRDRALVLSVPGHADVTVALDAAHAAPREVVVWRSTVRGLDEGDAAAAALSAYLGEPLRLVRFDPARPRLCNPEFAGESGAHTRFADGYPVLVIGAASLADLNARLAAKGADALGMNRFRPNIVVEGLEAFDEDHLAALEIGEITLRMVKACIRCEVPTIDPRTAQAGVEPLVTLSTYRQHATLDGIAFGMNAIVAAGAGGGIAVGTAVNPAFAF
ncbi:MAG TPA: MOSC N-terminal beta barrel domain-containing protein [Casimicrobiaceae bacterium]|nr:MOSC N-terminal beta barrel domain-containing protein [Casimicrobiaceae bacterium]